MLHGQALCKISQDLSGNTRAVCKQPVPKQVSLRDELADALQTMTTGARQAKAACHTEGSRSGGNAESQIHSAPSVHGTIIIQSGTDFALQL